MSNILWVDYGTKYIGLAYWNERNNMVTPVGSMSNDESLFFNIADILQRYHIETIVIGYPKQHKHLQAKIDDFLEQILFIEHEMKMIRWDEEYTSVEAWARTGDFTKNTAEDTVASIIILERYIASLEEEK